MKLYISLIASACLVAFSSEAQVIFSDDFTGDTPGSSPSGWTSVSPSTPTLGTLGSIVTNVAGNNEVNMLDNSSSSNTRIEEDFTTSFSGLHLSLTFTRNANITPTTSTQGLYVSLGTNTLTQGTQANRAAGIRLFNDGNYRVDLGIQNTNNGTFASGPSVSGTNSFGESGTTFNTHTLDIYAYAGVTGGATLGYTGPDSLAHILDPHSFAVYIDGALMLAPGPGTNTTANGNYGFENSSFYSQPTLGRLGFITGGSAAISGIDFLVDNIQLSAIPEPYTFALLGAGGLLLIGALRRRQR
jgi:hypothetical protein